MKKSIPFIYLLVFWLCIMLYSCNEEHNKQSKRTKMAVEVIDNKGPNSRDFIKKYPNGQLSIKGQYKNNKRDSLWISYYSNGSKQSENYYLNNKLHGNTISYFENGKIRYRGFYLEGIKHGKWIFWDLSGNKKVIEYKHGIKQ